jgi:drug/metabolite transporter (DMT)-like permease
MNTQTGISKWKVMLAFAAVYIIWGSTYLAIIVALKNIPPFLMCGLRFFFAGLLLLIWCIQRKEAWPNGPSLKINSVCGILMLFGGTVSVAWGEQYLPSSLAAIIVTSLPFWFILLDKKQWHFYFSNKLLILGLLVGFAGVAVLVGFDKPVHPFAEAGRDMQLIAILGIVAGGLAWSGGSLLAKYKPTGNSILMNAAMQLLVAGIFTLLVSGITGEWNTFSFNQVDTSSWMAVLYLTTFGSLVTYMCYLWLLKVRPAAQVSTYVYINPVVAVVLGALFLREQISWVQVLSLLIILGGVLLVNSVRFKAA